MTSSRDNRKKLPKSPNLETKRPKKSWPEGGPTLDKEKRKRKKERTSKLERGNHKKLGHLTDVASKHEHFDQNHELHMSDRWGRPILIATT